VIGQCDVIGHFGRKSDRKMELIESGQKVEEVFLWFLGRIEIGDLDWGQE
jgi:hypothetical protein